MVEDAMDGEKLEILKQCNSKCYHSSWVGVLRVFGHDTNIFCNLDRSEFVFNRMYWAIRDDRRRAQDRRPRHGLFRRPQILLACRREQEIRLRVRPCLPQHGAKALKLEKATSLLRGNVSSRIWETRMLLEELRDMRDLAGPSLEARDG
jgi:hypothetical protein